MKKILITGASGFIGSFIVEEALRRGMETWAAIRPTSSKAYLQDERIRFVELDFSSPAVLQQQLAAFKQQHGAFDYIVHAAGATKCIDKKDFFRINTDGTKYLIDAIEALGMLRGRFIYLSSLSIFGAIRETQPYQDILATDTPKPNTVYGESKKQAEDLLKLSQLPYIILRPTGVYGPREKDYFMMVKSIRDHIDFAAGYQQQDITFVYVQDVVQAVFLSLDKGSIGGAYFLSDGAVYQSSTFSNLIHKALGKPWWIRIKAPLFILKIITTIGDYMGRITGRISALNSDKYQILKQRNWRCDIKPAIEELGYKPTYDLERGVKEMMRWYKDNKWL